MKFASRLFGLLSIVFLFGSCSEEKKLERRLEDLWDVAVYQKSVFAEGEPVLDESGSFDNAGTIEFYTSGKGKFIMLVDLGEGTFVDNGDFTWTNTEDEVHIKYDGIIEKFQIVKNSKDEIELLSEDNDFNFDGAEPGIIYFMDERIVLQR